MPILEAPNQVPKDLLKQAFEVSSGFASQELTKGWYFWTNSANYDLHFNSLLDSENIRNIINERKQAGKKTFGLDLMGYGAFLRKFAFDGALAVALTDPRPEQLKEADSTLNQKLIVGDILKGKTRGEVRNWIKEQNPDDPTFQFEFCRPIEGILSIPADLDLQFMILNRWYKMLSEDGGIQLTQVPFGSREAVRKYVRILNSKGIVATYAEPVEEGITVPRMVLKIERSKNSSSQLPKMEI